MDKPSRHIDVRFIISTLLELIGILAIVCGASLIAPFLGFIVAGIGLVGLGWAIDPPARKPKGVKQ
ncbi:hypothetical protein [Mycobacterium phage WXIN]|nr:hypothetical protein [Mycobacterium phage WXIN]